MNNNKQANCTQQEIVGMSIIITFIIINAIINNDSIFALINAICGITYTFIAGKGNPICYVFGVIGSLFYCCLSFKNGLWGNLILYGAYYIPMQILGYFQWNKNLHAGQAIIKKRKASFKELIIILILTTACSILLSNILIYIKDPHPYLDSITTILSISGMYLTVRRALEQWLFWMLVNTLSIILWVKIALSGGRVYSTIIMWTVYLLLAVYFYFNWKKELKESVQ